MSTVDDMSFYSIGSESSIRCSDTETTRTHSTPPSPIDSWQSRLLTDFCHFQRMHSWDRYLPLVGTQFVMFLAKGEQIENSINTNVIDTTSLHWHFLPINIGKFPACIKRYTVTFGPFLRGVETAMWDDSDEKIRYFKGIDNIRANNPNFDTWLADKYPNINPASLVHDDDESCKALADMECSIYLVNVLRTAERYVAELGFVGQDQIRVKTNMFANLV